MLRKKIYGFGLFAAALVTLSITPLAAQDWIAPEADAAIENPREFNLEHVENGKELYMINCKSCHGDPGKNNALPLSPMPPDVISDKMHANSEGSLFYKITVGKGAMPPFEQSLSVDERWDLVNYLMNYHPDVVAVLVELPPVKALIMASVQHDSATVEVYAEYEAEDGSMLALAGTPITIGVKKAFGSLPIGEVITDDAGKGSFMIPASTIGDETGLVDVFISLGEDFIAEPVLLEKAALGIPKGTDPQIRKGVLWSTNDNMPTWLQIGFALVVLGAWATIGWVVLQIVKVPKLGKED